MLRDVLVLVVAQIVLVVIIVAEMIAARCVRVHLEFAQFAENVVVVVVEVKAVEVLLVAGSERQQLHLAIADLDEVVVVPALLIILWEKISSRKNCITAQLILCKTLLETEVE